MRFFVVAVHVSTENLTPGMAVLVEEVKRYFVEREKMCVQQAVSRLVGERRADTRFGNCSALGVKSGRNDHGLYAGLAEPGKTQYTGRQVFVLRRYAKALLDEAVDADSFWRAREKAFFSEFVAADLVYLAGREVRLLGGWTVE